MASTICHKVILIGNSSVGKTSIISQFVYGTSSANQKTTVGIDYFIKSITVGDKTATLQIWDTAGQEKFHSLIPSYMRDSTVALLTFDITSKTTFEDLRKWHQMILNSTKVFVIGNKIDLEFDRQVTREEGEEFAKEIDALYFETSARDGTGVNEMFEKIPSIPLPQINDEQTQKSGNESDTIVIKLNDEKQSNNTDSRCYC